MRKTLNLKQTITTVVVAATMLGATVPTAYAQASVTELSRIQETPFKTVLTFNQHFAEDGSMAVTAKSGPMTKSSSGYGLERNVQNLTIQTFSGFPRALTPHLGQAVTLSQQQALQKAKLWMNANVSSHATRFAAELREVGASAGILTYSEEVFIQREELEPIKKVLSFVMTVDREGRATYGDPVLTTPEPDILYATYTPLRPGDDFNENWVLPNAGYLSYQVLDHRGNVKLATRHINVNGAYDASPGGNGGACFMQRETPGCNIVGSVPDVRSLMLKYGADYAVADFTNQIVPLYDPVTATDGSTDYVPRAAIAYTDRRWNCIEYTNEGEYGFVLDLQIERWYGKLDTDQQVTSTYVETKAGTMISPVERFHKTVMATSLTAHPDYFVISPVAGDNTLFRIGDPALRGVTHIAPVRSAANTDELLNARVTGSFPLVKESGGEGWSIFRYGVAGDNYWGYGEYAGSIDFNLKSINDFKEFSLLTQNFDDWLLITINGTAVFSGPYDGIVDLKVVSRTEISSSSRCLYGTSEGRWYCGQTEFTVSAGSTPEGAWKTLSMNSESSIGSLGNYYCDSSYGTRTCVSNVFANYKTCTALGDEGISYGYSCSNSVCAGGSLFRRYSVEYKMADGSVRCGFHEHNENWNRSYERSILPYLRSGANSLRALLFVGGKGEMFVRFRVEGCGTEWGLPFTGVPPIPANATTGALIDKLNNMHARPVDGD